MNRRMFCGGVVSLPALLGSATPQAKTTGDIHYSPTYTIDSRVDRAEVIRMIEQARERTVQEIADRARRGGVFSASQLHSLYRRT